jgi:hypothetical protein
MLAFKEFTLKTRPLIMGAVRRLGVEELQPFIKSLRASGYQGDCVLFTTSVSASTLRYLHDQKIRTVPFFYPAVRNHQPFLYGWKIWKPLFGLLREQETKLKLARLVWDLFFLRFLFYRNYLRTHEEYTHIMITDVRDVIFQKDPFIWMGQKQGVFCFEEASGLTIGNSSANSQMVREVFGANGLAQICHQQVSCAGITFGTRTSLLRYLQSFLDLALQAKNLWPCSGSDQGIHNYIIHQIGIPALQLVNNEGPVFTMGCVPRNQIRQNSLGQVINYEGTAYPILHQYDRFKDLVLAFVQAKTAER